MTTRQALLLARPTLESGAARASRLFDDGTRLVSADLHNHTLFSDGQGHAEDAFAAMRAAGLDVAALTDHAKIGYDFFSRYDPCAALGSSFPCRGVIGLNEAGWRRTGALADAADDPGAFTAIRGFEWTHPTLGHVNVWLTERWIDALHTSGIGWDGIGDEAHRLPGIGRLLERVLSGLANDPGMRPFYDWLAAEQGLAGFNHPGREPGWFDAFRYDARIADRMVTLELFNKTDEYLFDDPGSSPLNACLEAGWRTGLIGVSDEHRDDWGSPVGKGRAGLWVKELSREGVREALLARRVFATRERGLRLDASADGVRMGGTLRHRDGPVAFALDIAHPGWAGRVVQIQVLRPGSKIPEVAHVEDVTLPASGELVARLRVDIDADDGGWIVLRLADPAGHSAQPGPDDHPGSLRGLAYASPFWIDPTGPA